MEKNRLKEADIIKNQRRKFSSAFKSKVALEAITEKLTINELAEKFDLNRNQVAEWKKKLISKAHLLFQSDENFDDEFQKEKLIEENILIADKNISQSK